MLVFIIWDSQLGSHGMLVFIIWDSQLGSHGMLVFIIWDSQLSSHGMFFVFSDLYYNDVYRTLQILLNYIVTDKRDLEEAWLRLSTSDH
jgi:hypothetical protein